MSVLDGVAVTSMANMISQLNTFLGGTPGWTTHHAPVSGEFAARKTGSGFDVGFATQWDTTAPDALGIYHFHGAVYNAGNSPWAQNDDSGNGAASSTNATIAGQRHAKITDTPIMLWVFEDDDYFHAVVKSNADNYVHFGAGVLDKFNDWAGGEYVYGHWQDTAYNTFQALRGDSTMLLDGLAVDMAVVGHYEQELWAATIHATGLANQPVGGKYLVCMGAQASGSLGNDRQAAPTARRHMLGGYRAGPVAKSFGSFRGSKMRGLNPMYPVVQYYWDRFTGGADEMYGPMSQMKDVRGLNIREFTAGDEIVVGGDTWVVFPSAEKAISDSVSTMGSSLYQGIAYKKVAS
jgi:hypothetical protein